MNHSVLHKTNKINLMNQLKNVYKICEKKRKEILCDVNHLKDVF